MAHSSRGIESLVCSSRASSSAAIANRFRIESSLSATATSWTCCIARSSEVCNEEIAGAIGAIASLSDTLNAQMATFSEPGVEAIVRIAQDDHVVFKKTILDVVLGQSHLRPDAVSTHHTCRLDRWAAEVSPTVRALPTFARLEAPHRRVHELRREIVGLVQDGRRDEALAHFDELEAASADVIAILKQLADELRTDR